MPFTGAGGTGATYSSSTKLVAAAAVSVMLPSALATVTEVVGRVIRKGAATVVYDERVPVEVSDPLAQALLTAAVQASTSAAPGSSVASPALVSTITATSAPAQVGQILPGPASTQVSFLTTTYVGPQTIDFGPLQACPYTVPSGGIDYDTVLTYPQASATDEVQATATTTSVYDVDATVPVPTITTPPAISGTPKAGGTLMCPTGSWTNNPTTFAYQWGFDGTPVQGVTGDTYTLPASDEGITITCTVTASNAGGAEGSVTSNGVLVPVPHVAHCPGATGSLSGHRSVWHGSDGPARRRVTRTPRL